MGILTWVRRVTFHFKKRTHITEKLGEDVAKMDQATARIRQAQGICLLRTDYLEDR